ncbi:MAG: SLC13 family permease [Cellulosilyticaceae bacterium]
MEQKLSKNISTNTSQKQQLISGYAINSIIGIFIMFGFQFIPPLEPITPIGMQVIGVFIGVIYLWTTVDPIWPSLLGIFALGMSAYAPMGQILTNFFGDPTVVQVIFMMVFIGALVHNNITTYIGRWFLTRKIINNKPWVFTAMLLLGVYVLAATSSAFAPIFLFWPVLYGIFKEVGIKPGDKYATLSLLAVVMTSLFGFSTAPFKDVPLILLSNYKTLSGTDINAASYMGLTISLSLLGILLLILIMKFILRPDVSKLSNINIDMFNKQPLPPLSTKQKILSFSFVLYIILMLLPGILPNTMLIQNFLDENKFGLVLLFVAVLCCLNVGKKPIIEYQAIKSSHVQWSTVFLIAAALTIGNAVTADSTGVTPFLKELFTPIFGGAGQLVFTILILILGITLTNFCNSAVVGIIFLPIIFSFVGEMGVLPDPIVALFIYITLIAAITPAASPFAAIIHSNKEWFDTKSIYKYTTIFSIAILLLVIIAGIPLSTLFF